MPGLLRALVIISVVGAVGCLKAANASPLCADLLTPASDSRGLIAYLRQLLELRVIGSSELIFFRNSLLKDSSPRNPLTEEKARDGAAFMVHRQALDVYLSSRSYDRVELLEWLDLALKRSVDAAEKRNQIEDQTQDPFQRMTFRRVRPGRFKMGTADIELTEAIEVMTTPVTQKQWVSIMGENPSYFRGKVGSAFIPLMNGSIEMLPDHPVEMVSWWSVLVYANKLSEMHGLRPVYDLAGIKFNDVALGVYQRTVLKNERDIFAVAAKGALGSEDEAVFPKINARNGDIYFAEGYRLPTEAEQGYLLYKGASEQSDELSSHAWYKDNAEGSTHPVAQLRPLIIANGLFFDLYGNVEEWGHDRGGSEIKDAVNPHRSDPDKMAFPPGHDGRLRISKGGCWQSPYWRSTAANISESRPDFRSKNTGFRLVRTVSSTSR